MQTTLINPNPLVYKTPAIKRKQLEILQEVNEDELDPIDSLEVFGTFTRASNPLAIVLMKALLQYVSTPIVFIDITEARTVNVPFIFLYISMDWSSELVCDINDPEHPFTLKELNVTTYESISVNDIESYIKIYFTPTTPHCSMATLIGLCIRVKLLRSLPKRFKFDILLTPGSHASESAVNKQLNDKERVAAALENSSLLDVVNNCIATSE